MEFIWLGDVSWLRISTKDQWTWDDSLMEWLLILYTFIRSDICIIKNLDGSKSTFLTNVNLSSDYHHCLKFKYLITGSMTAGKENRSNSLMDVPCHLVCLNFYGKIRTNTRNQSRLFSIFCISNKQAEFQWYSFNVSLPTNISMVNRSEKIRKLFHIQYLDQCSNRKWQYW